MDTGEAHLRALFDWMPQLGWTARPDGFIDFYNRGWYAYTGTTFAEMQGWGWERVHDPQRLPEVIDRWKASLRSGTPFEMEFPLRRHDGVFRWFLARANPLRDAEGQIVRWIGINTDIHERKQAGATNQARLQLLVDSIRDYAVFMLDPNGLVVTWSPGAERIKQYRADEIIGRHFSIFYPEEDRRAGKPEMELEVAGREGRFEDEDWRVRKDGSRFWANVVISAVRDPTGALVGFSKVTRDLTERRRAEQERVALAVARAAQERLRFLADASGILASTLEYETALERVARLAVPRYGDWCAVDLLDADGKLRPVAVAHADPAKVEAVRALQQRWPSDPDAAVGPGEVLRRGEAVLYGEIPAELLAQASRDPEHLRALGELGLRSALLVPIRAAGRMLGTLSLVWAESPNRFSREDLPLIEELGRRMGVAIENALLYREVQQAVKLRDEFLSIASHELRTPLTSMQLQLSGLQRTAQRQELSGDKMARRIDVIDQQLQRLTSLINGLLDVSRAAAGRLQLDLEDVDLASVVGEAVARLRPDVEAAGCSLSVAVEPGIVGRWDRSRLDQVVTNFVTNAMKYGAGKPIEIGGHRTPGGTAVLWVRDHGIGIAPSDQGRIFERFGRAVSAENYGGLGLGLWIVKQCVSAMQGRVTVESEPGQGALFKVELPLARVEDRPSVH